MKPKKIIGIICIILSLCLFIIPPIVKYIQYQKQEAEKDALLSEIEKLLNDTENTELETETTTPENTLPSTETQPPSETTQPVYKPYRTSTNEEIDGILKIPVIDLELPILTNVTEKGLNKTCARVTNTNPPGCDNYCIMGHTMDAYGKVFNRLKEVKKGDIVTIVARDYTYNYEIYETFKTKGLDMNILEDIKDKQIITLFCCSYHVKNGRLVVRGELTSITPNG